MAFLQPPSVRQPIFRAPAIVLWLIAGLAAAHIARVLASPVQSEALIHQYAFIPARYSPAFLRAHGLDPGSLLDRAVPFVSYIALHNDFTHLAINCLWLLAFGPIVARRLGPVLFLLFFLICGVLGVATHLAFNWASPVPVIGASAAISGLMAAGLRLLPTEGSLWNTAPGQRGAGRLAPILSRQIVIFSLVWVGVNLLAGLTGIGTGGEAGPIAWEAHLGGYAAGLLLAGSFDRLRPQPVGTQPVAG